MAQFTAEGIPSEAIQRVIDFLNAAQTARDIAGYEPQQGPIIDNPNVGYGDQVADYDIGELVARRILDRRDSIGGFTDISQLSDIAGFGIDKFNDLIGMFTYTENQSLSASPELFRFLHVKRIDPTPTSQTRERFIFHPESKQSRFLRLADRQAQGASDSNKVADEYTFMPFNTKEDIKNIDEGVFAFALWLRNSRGNLTFKLLQEKTMGLRPLSLESQLILWENLFFQSKESPSSEIVRNGVIAVLQANAVLAQFKSFAKSTNLTFFTKQAKKRFERIASASVVIPRKLLAARILPKQETTSLDTRGKQLLKERLEADIAQQEIAQVTATLAQLEKAQKVHIAQTRAAQQGEDKESAETVPSKDALSKAFLSPLVTATALQVFDRYYHPSHETIKDVIIEMKNHASQLYPKLQTALGKTKMVRINGAIIPVTDTPQTSSLVLQGIKQGDEVCFYMTQYFDSPEKKITQALLSTTAANENKKSNYIGRVIAESKHHVTLAMPVKEKLDNDTPLALALRLETENERFSQHIEAKNYLLRTSFFYNSFNSDDDGIPGNDERPLYGVTRVGVGEFMKVEQELCCYVEGEVSHIENIMAKEYKERATRNLTSTETISEESYEREVENLSDSTSTDRHELQAETSQILQQDASRSFGASAGVSGGFGDHYRFQADAYLQSTNSSSSSSTFNESESYAKEVTERAMQRIVEKTSYKRTSRMLREYEENNKHGFDNRDGSEHVTGIYRWIDKIYKNHLVNYGKRLMYDFVVPEPAKNYRRYMANDETTPPAMQVLTKPDEPSDIGLSAKNDLSRENYAHFASLYGAEVEPCLDEYQTVGGSYAELIGHPKLDEEYVDGAFHFALELPEGYQCFKYDANCSIEKHGSNNDSTFMVLFIGDNNTAFSQAYYANNVSVKDIEKELPISIRARDVGAFNLNVVAECRLKQETFKQWQDKTYLAIIAAYQRRLQEYNDAYLAIPTENGNETDYSFNPLASRAIEKRELKRIAIELITAPFGINMAPSVYYANTAMGNYKVYRTPVFERHAAHVKFLEQAFDWELMAYLLYPYYWAYEARWKDLLSATSSADFIFQAFLQSGMARMTVPVRPGFESAVMYYLDTGIILNGDGYALEGDDELYLSIAEEMEVDEGEILSTWETRVPTSLTIVQSNSAALQRDGLPCFCEDGTPLAKGKSLLQGLEEKK